MSFTGTDCIFGKEMKNLVCFIDQNTIPKRKEEIPFQKLIRRVQKFKKTEIKEKY
jgi:DNA-directed RNA polymerase delta subunit